MIRSFLLPLLSLALAVTAAATAGAEESASEQWYRIELGGQPAGWMVAREAEQDARRITEASTRMQVKRGGATVALEIETRFVERADGTPVRAWSRQLLGETPIETTYDFGPDGVAVKTRRGASVEERRAALPSGEWLTPWAAQQAVRDRLAAGDDAFTVRSLDPQVGLTVVETAWQRAPEDGQPKDEAASFSRWHQRLSIAPGLVTVVELDGEGRMQRSTTPFMGSEMTLILSERDEALAAEGAPELLVQSLIYPSRPIERPRALTRAVFELRQRQALELELPSVGDQRAEAIEGGVRVEVALGSSPALEAPPPETVAELLRDSTFIDVDDPEVVRLTAQALAGLEDGDGEEIDDATRAEALRAFVARHVADKNLNSLLATAAEVASSRAGDCTEHSVLLTAMLRAAGIPARVVTGLIYIDSFAGAAEVFGYHMWSQALVDSRWLDLDATLERRFDAAHIAFTTTALNDDTAALVDMAAIVPMMGALDVDVVETVY